MTWTDIGANEEACALVMDLMIELENQRVVYEANGGPITAANKAHVIDELFEAWWFLCYKERLPTDGPPQNLFANWLATHGEAARPLAVAHS